MTITAEPATDYDEYCYRQYRYEQEAEAMTLADVATVETMVDAIEACRSVLPELVYRSLLRLAETLDQTIDEQSHRLYMLREMAAEVRQEYDLTDNEAARLLLHEIEES
jgi:hypothetical protein